MNLKIKLDRRPRRPVLAYDAKCGLCARLASIGRRISPKVQFEPNAIARATFSEIPPDEFERSVVLIERDGAVSTGALATWKTLSYGPRVLRLPLWMYRHVWGFACLSESVYGFVSRNRRRCRRP